MSVLLHRCSNQSAVIVVIWADFNIVTCLLLNTSLHYDLVYMGFYYLDTYFMSLPQVLVGASCCDLEAFFGLLHIPSFKRG